MTPDKRGRPTTNGDVHSPIGRREHDRQIGPYAFSLLALVISGVTAISGLHQLDRRETDASRACGRAQTNRENINRVAAAAFLVTDAASRSTTNEAAGELYATVADSLSYEPPVDCVAATGDPGAYEAPLSVPFRELGYEDARVVLARGRLDP